MLRSWNSVWFQKHYLNQCSTLCLNLSFLYFGAFFFQSRTHRFRTSSSRECFPGPRLRIPQCWTRQPYGGFGFLAILPLCLHGTSKSTLAVETLTCSQNVLSLCVRTQAVLPAYRKNKNQNKTLPTFWRKSSSPPQGDNIVRWPKNTSAPAEHAGGLHATVGRATLHVSPGRACAKKQGERPSLELQLPYQYSHHNTTKDKTLWSGVGELGLRQTFGDAEPKEVVAHNLVAIFVGLRGWTRWPVFSRGHNGISPCFLRLWLSGSFQQR